MVEKLSPVIVFIDELDGIGSRNRKSTLISEDKTILALTAAIDKINQKNLPIWFFAATNRTTDIDPALIRTGRFGGNRFIILDPDKDTVREMIDKNRNFIKCSIPRVIDPLFFDKYSNIRLDHNLITKFNREEDEEKKRQLLLNLFTQLFSLHQNKNELSLCGADVISILDSISINAYKNNRKLDYTDFLIALNDKYEIKKNSNKNYLSVSNNDTSKIKQSESLPKQIKNVFAKIGTVLEFFVKEASIEDKKVK